MQHAAATAVASFRVCLHFLHYLLQHASMISWPSETALRPHDTPVGPDDLVKDEWIDP